jgi:TPR repeat protein
MWKRASRSYCFFLHPLRNRTNSYAAYALGKLYLQEESIPKDVDAAVKWLEKSADLVNQFAQYLLANSICWAKTLPKDVGTAVRWLTAFCGTGTTNMLNMRSASTI